MIHRLNIGLGDYAFELNCAAHRKSPQAVNEKCAAP
jgi:hypothetical protein